MLVVAEAEVTHAEFFGKRSHFRSVGVVTEEYMDLGFVRVVHGRASICRFKQNIGLLVVGRDKDIDIRKELVRHHRHLRLIHIAERKIVSQRLI